MTGLSTAFAKPFPQQIAAFRIRLQELKSTTHWTDVWQDANEKGFMVAGAEKVELLADFAAAIDKAQTKGTTFDEFKRDFRKAVADNDWRGWTGEKTQKGQDWRARVIYKTNLSTSYAAGRFAQLQAANFPFWVYRHGASREPRHEHLALDGLVLPSDHPFWARYFPPNGWGCSCYVVGARSEKAALRLGGKPEVKLPEGWDSVDPVTLAPPGIDKGWAYAPGSSVVTTVNTLAARAVDWDYKLSTAYMRSLPDSTRDAFSQAYRRNPGLQKAIDDFAAESMTRHNASDRMQTLGLTTQEFRAKVNAIGANLPQDDILDIAIPEEAVRHVIRRHSNAKIEESRGQRAITLYDFSLLTKVIDAPDSISVATPAPGQPFAFEVTKSFGDHWLVALFEYRARRRRISLVTMVMKKVGKKGGASPTLTP